LVLLVGCATTHGTGGSGPASFSGVGPATKKELPWLDVFGGRMQTTLFYGPWQCRQEFMRNCQQECSQQGHRLMGCMWLADIKLDWEGRLVIPPLPVKAGGRYALWHCCCDYRKLTSAEKEPLRDQWESMRSAFRRAWSKKFGEWPEEEGVSWPGHHIRDLQHGGNPTDGNNILPAPPDVHKVFNKQYPACYSGAAPWNTVGPDLPYTDR
jgi:hypothetical protein